jgi:hypothetical protein
MSNNILDEFIDVMMSRILAEEDAKIFKAMDDIFLPRTEFVCTVRFMHGLKLDVERICDGSNQCFFTLRKRGHIIERKCIASLFDGVECFMPRLESEDADILWNWFLECGK